MDQGQWRSGTADYDTEYYEQPGQDSIMDNMEQEDGMDSEQPKKKYKPWIKLGPDGRPIKRKPNLARRNMIFRKALQPKNSVMCLNELKPGLKYVTEPVANIGNFCVSVEVNDQTFRGYGSTKDLAKQAAAEAALVSFVKPPTPKPKVPAVAAEAGVVPTPVPSVTGAVVPAAGNGEEIKAEEDTTPWKTLASFAMYKLFTDWREGRIGICTSGQQGFVPNMAMAGAMGMPSMQGFSMVPQQAQPTPTPKEEPLQHINAHLNRNLIPTVGKTQGEDKQLAANTAPKPISESKLNSENQRTKHPVMILHQLCPIIAYSSTENQDPTTGVKSYTVTATINGQTFSGQGSAIKKAKLLLAKEALKSLYNIDNIYTTG